MPGLDVVVRRAKSGQPTRAAGPHRCIGRRSAPRRAQGDRAVSASARGADPDLGEAVGRQHGPAPDLFVLSLFLFLGAASARLPTRSSSTRSRLARFTLQFRGSEALEATAEKPGLDPSPGDARRHAACRARPPSIHLPRRSPRVPATKGCPRRGPHRAAPRGAPMRSRPSSAEVALRPIPTRVLPGPSNQSTRGPSRPSSTVCRRAPTRTARRPTRGRSRVARGSPRHAQSATTGLARLDGQTSTPAPRPGPPARARASPHHRSGGSPDRNSWQPRPGRLTPAAFL
jgi:hypothetical protein